MVKDSCSMQDLIRELGKAHRGWAFSLAFDCDYAGTTGTPLLPSALALPKPPTPGKRGKRKAGGPSAAAAAAADSSDFGWLDDAAGGAGAPATAAAAAAGGPQQPEAEQQQWSWSVVGVAFSVGDGHAWVVPLHNSSKDSGSSGGGSGGGSSSGGRAGSGSVRVGTDARLRELWAGLQVIFGSRGCGDNSSSGSSSGPIIIDGSEGDASAALMEQQAAAAVDSYRKRLQDLARAAQLAAAADAKDAGSSGGAGGGSGTSSRAPDAPAAGGSAGAAAAATVGAGQQPPGSGRVHDMKHQAWWGPGQVKITFALKQQLALLAQPPVESGLQGIQLAEPYVDVRVAAWCLDPEDQRAQEKSWTGSTGCRSLTGKLEDLVDKWAGKEVKKAATAGLPRPGQPGAGRYLGACRRACMAYRLYRRSFPLVKCEGALPALATIEMPLVRVLADMEGRGICLDRQVLEAQMPAMEDKLKQLEAQAAAANGGEKFSLASAQEVGRVLFDKLKLVPPPDAKALKSGQPSTAASVLEEMVSQHPLPAIILQHRKISKILTGFLDQFVKEALKAAQRQAPDGAGLVRIRGQFMQTNTSTGRLAMEEPSLQTIPRPVEYELAATSTQGTPPDAAAGALTPAAAAAAAAARRAGAGSGAGAGSSAGVGGSGGGRVQESNVRAAFVAPPGWVLLGADYKQLELRLMAHFSGDGILLSALSSAADPFVELAANWLGLPRHQVDRVARDRAKRLAYGVLYGMGPYALAKELDVEPAEAQLMMYQFFEKFPGVRQWQKAVVDGCKRTGWVTTLAGRRRHLHHINDTAGSGPQAQAERQAVNTVCQGSAADAVKGVMVCLQEQLAATGLAEHCHMLLQVHDELLFEVEASHVPAAAALVRGVMEDAAAVWALRVALPVKVSVGPSWGQLQEYTEG